MKTADKELYKLTAPELAPRLIGCFLCRKMPDGRILKLRITETEAYFGEEDTACHAHRGKTPRTEVMYRAGGCAYVYLCYGIHSLLNIVCGDEGHPEAVLIRGVEGANGPGKLTKLMGITREQNGTILLLENGLWIEDREKEFGYMTDKRVGIDYAEPADREREWRFIIKEI